MNKMCIDHQLCANRFKSTFTPMISMLKEKQMLGEYYYKNWSQTLQEKIKIQLPLNITGTKTTANRGSKSHMHRLRMAATAKRHDFQQVNHLAVKKWLDEPPHIL
jgi:hypothetical protein